MTQTDIPTWSLTFQLKLMAALDAAWAILDASNDPAAIRQARDKAKAVGELAAMVRKVALIVPTARGKPPGDPMTAAAAAGLHVTQGMANLSAMVAASREPPSPQPAAPVAAQAEHARRALDKLKGGRRGRL